MSQEHLITLAAFCSRRGWTPATSSNFSLRKDADSFWVTRSGPDKGQLTADDILLSNLEGQVQNSDKKPSAETLLHAQLYRHDPSIGAIAHTHSVHSVVLSRRYAQQGAIVLEQYELLKALRGISTHDTSVSVPIFKNTQNIAELAQEVETLMNSRTQALYGYLIAGHGLYTWGQNFEEAQRHTEALETLLTCFYMEDQYS